MPRLAGNRGAIYLADSGTKLLDSYLWEFEAMQDVLDASIKGERWKRYEADVGHGRVRVETFVSNVAATEVASSLETNLVSALGVNTPVDFVLHMVDGNAIVTGQGYIVRSQTRVARDGIITDQIEIEVDGLPTVA